MEELINKLSIPTNQLKSETIQEVFLKAKQSLNQQNRNEEYWNKVVEDLWHHLQCGLNNFDDQLFCATSFYSVLSITDKHDFYLNKILHIISNEYSVAGKDNCKSSHVVSLMYGMFQSGFTIQITARNLVNINEVLDTMFKLLTIMAYKYSRFTFIIFKIINSLKKVCGTDLQQLIYNNDNQIILLNLVNHNWENPVTGVRDHNKEIFRTLLTVADDLMYQSILDEINTFYWNKAKYLMLAEIVDQYNIGVSAFIYSNDWVDGLIYSLHKPGLVSAGADMYFAVLNKLRSEDEWCNMFLSKILEIMNGSSSKAIEHFTNYWCLTTFKKYPTLVQILLKEMEDPQNSEQNLFSCLCIMKQGNKLGLLSKNWKSIADYKHTEKTVLDGLENCNTHVRILAFDVVCVSQGKAMPSNAEFKLVLNYFYNNMNSDCTVLRISMLGSLKCFLNQLHTSYLNHTKHHHCINLESMQEFCINFQKLIIASLDINGNYQRKICCLKVANIFWTTLKEVSIRKRHKEESTSNNTVIGMLMEKGCWLLSEEKCMRILVNLLNDPTDDIRENVILLLLNHYSEELKRTALLNKFIEGGLKCMSSKFFYEISCGRSMFKLIINILSKESNSEATFKTVEEIFSYAHRSLISEYKSKRSVVESIENGKQLNTFIMILKTVLEICYENSYKIHIPNESILELLECLDCISNQFAWEQEHSTSSDFSQMSDMVQNIITKSGYNPGDDSDYTKISGLEQIVLNCLWLNIKASCDLTAVLIKYQRGDTAVANCEMCLNIIVHVLETCRHKGAIEAAGTFLGQCIQHLTSLPEDSELSKMPYTLLKCKLDELISEASKMTSITRRGAGLSIMVHKIVSSDMKRGKPLFHYFVNTLLETCTNSEDIPKNLQGQIVENEQDLPKAVYIHFLTKIVMDSSLASDMMYYSVKLAELAFDNLKSPHWQIRNAALQLYGALIPKLVGQKRASGSGEETIATVACDELRTHSPMLWIHIQNQLKNVDHTDTLQYHSTLVPILNMLANIAPRYNFTWDMKQQEDIDTELLGRLVLLLDSPIYGVRRLTAKSISNIYSLEAINDIIMQTEQVSENFLHGSLMLISFYKFHYNIGSFSAYFNNLQTKFSCILKSGKHSYLCYRVFEDIFMIDDLNVDINLTLSEVRDNIHAPGIHQWANERFKKCIQNSSWDIIPQLTDIILKSRNFEQYFTYLLHKIEKDKSTPKEILKKVATMLLTSEIKFESYTMWKILYQISLQINLYEDEEIDLQNIVKYLEGKAVSYKLRYIIPFSARLFAKTKDDKTLLNISKIVNILTDSERTDVDMRYIAVMANNELATDFRSLPESVKIMTIKSEVVLLQDEDEEVRNMSIYFFRNIQKSRVAPQPYICLLRILETQFLNSILTKNGIKALCHDLEDLILNFSSKKNSYDYNPFACDSKNIYLEVVILEQLVDNLKKSLL